MPRYNERQQKAMSFNHNITVKNAEVLYLLFQHPNGLTNAELESLIPKFDRHRISYFRKCGWVDETYWTNRKHVWFLSPRFREMHRVFDILGLSPIGRWRGVDVINWLHAQSDTTPLTKPILAQIADQAYIVVGAELLAGQMILQLEEHRPED